MPVTGRQGVGANALAGPEARQVNTSERLINGMTMAYPNQKIVRLALGAVLVASLVFQVFRGWDLRVFWLSLLVNISAVLFLLRFWTPSPANAWKDSRTGKRRFIFQVVFWILVAVALFFGFRAFQ